MASKDEHFYRNGIRALPERWAKIVANDGQYFEWLICNHFFTIKLHFHQKNIGNLVAHLIFSNQFLHTYNLFSVLKVFISDYYFVSFKNYNKVRRLNIHVRNAFRYFAVAVYVRSLGY